MLVASGDTGSDQVNGLVAVEVWPEAPPFVRSKNTGQWHLVVGAALGDTDDGSLVIDSFRPKYGPKRPLLLTGNIADNGGLLSARLRRYRRRISRNSRLVPPEVWPEPHSLVDWQYRRQWLLVVGPP